MKEEYLFMHIISQIGGALGNFHFWPIHFLGRIEFFAEHWYVLTMEHERCSETFDSLRKEGKTHDYKLAHSMRQFKHNEIESADVEGDEQRKVALKQKEVNVEQLVFMENKELFEKAVEYYLQDFVCFGYNMTHEAFVKHVTDKYYF